ncbi:MAG: DUF1294 domain-containing protein [Clostridia bacterium]|nr:DUF1294 domain-containing protein [Clostridia bacterium]
MIFYIALIYVLIVSVISVIITVYDKHAAKAKKRRVPEKTLLIFGFIGGAAAMYITMLIIRHKTKKKKFMIPLPVFAVMHIVALVLIALYL